MNDAMKLQAIRRQDQDFAEAINQAKIRYAFHKDYDRFLEETDLLIEKAFEACGMVAMHAQFETLRRLRK